MPTIDITKLDAEIEEHKAQIGRLENLRKMAADPKLVSLFQSLIVRNGFAAVHARRKTAVATRVAGKGRKGDLRDAVAKAVISAGTKFTANRVVEIMQENGFVFGAKNPKIAVNSVFRAMMRKGNLMIAVEGMGRAPHEYTRVGKMEGLQK